LLSVITVIAPQRHKVFQLTGKELLGFSLQWTADFAPTSRKRQGQK